MDIHPDIWLGRGWIGQKLLHSGIIDYCNLSQLNSVSL